MFGRGHARGTHVTKLIPFAFSAEKEAIIESSCNSLGFALVPAYLMSSLALQ